MLEPLEQERRERREIGFLARSQVAPERLRRLLDPGLRRRRLQGTVRRTRNRLERSLARLRQENLEALHERASRMLLSRLTGRASEALALPRQWTRALSLLGSGKPGLLLSFLEDLAFGRSPVERPANRDWLERARLRGIDGERWLNGFSLQLGELAMATETDPLEVLQMGSYFGTCLDLEGGVMAGQTLLNALDVNKQVLFVRRPDGAVVGRMMVAANLDRRFLTYHLYGDFSDGQRAAVWAGLERYAAACGLRPSPGGQPEDLHRAGWQGDNPRLPGLLGDHESLFCQAVASKDRPLLRWVSQQYSDFAPAAELRALTLPGPKPRSPAVGSQTIELAAFTGKLDWLACAPEVDLGAVLRGLPWSVEAVRDLLHRPWGRDAWWNGSDEGPPAVLGLLSLDELFRLLERLERHSTGSRIWARSWGRVVESIVRRDQDLEPLRRALLRKGMSRLVALNALYRVKLDGCWPLLERIQADFSARGSFSLLVAVQTAERQADWLRRRFERFSTPVNGHALLRAVPDDRQRVERSLTFDPDLVGYAADLQAARELRSPRLAAWLASLGWPEVMAMVGDLEFPPQTSDVDHLRLWERMTEIEQILAELDQGETLGLRRLLNSLEACDLVGAFRDDRLERRLVRLQCWPLLIRLHDPNALTTGLLIAEGKLIPSPDWARKLFDQATCAGIYALAAECARSQSERLQRQVFSGKPLTDPPPAALVGVELEDEAIARISASLLVGRNFILDRPTLEQAAVWLHPDRLEEILGTVWPRIFSTEPRFQSRRLAAFFQKGL